MEKQFEIVWSWRQPYTAWRPMTFSTYPVETEVTDVSEARAVLARIMAL